MPIFNVGAAGTTASDSGYNIDNSLRFEPDNNTVLRINPSTSASTRIFTYSFWTKRNLVTADRENYLGAGESADQNHITIGTDFFQVRHYAGGHTFQVYPSNILADSSAWYHFVVAVDTTQGTASNRIKIYINGSQVTSFSTADYPTQNFDFDFMQNGAETFIGRRSFSVAYKLDAYLSEVVFIDGTQLTSTSFGEFDSDTGIWKPIDVSELTFGNAGFYLDFKSTATKHTITAAGDAKHSTTQQKIGATSIAFDGTGDYLSVADGTDWDLGTGAFTVEMWAKIATNSSDYTGLITMGSPQFSFRLNAQGRIQFLQDHGGTRGNTSDSDTSGTNLRDNAWHHVAVVRESDATWDLYVDGTSEYSGTGMTGNITSIETVEIGRRVDSSSNYLTGYLDEIRVSKTARYTSNFTAPTTPFVSDNNTLLLIHSDTTNNSTTFTDSSGVVAGLGNDQSGGANHFTVDNLTYVDQATDTPTNNFCTINPLQRGPRNNGADSSGILTLGNTKCVLNGSGDDFGATMAVSTGKWYYEVKLITSLRHGAGFCDVEHFTDGDYDASNQGIVNSGGYIGSAKTSTGSQYKLNATSTTSAASYADNDIVGYAFDVDAGEMKIYQNGTLRDTITGIPTGVTYMPIIGDDSSTDASFEVNFGGSSGFTISSGNTDGKYGNFEYAPPSGYYAICTKRLAEFG